MTTLLSRSSLSEALALPDLTDSRQQLHGMQLLIEEIHQKLSNTWRCKRQIIRSNPIVPLENNYDRLGYPADGAARDERYTRYVTDNLILRTQTSCAIPDLLSGLSVDPPSDLLLILPGLVYRRDSIDRLHCGEPHQIDLWRIVDNKNSKSMTTKDLNQMIATVMDAAIPELEWRTSTSPHPYTEQGVQIDALWNNEWIEVGECGLTAQPILDAANLKNHSGLAMGLGLDRLLMLRKNIPDIRLLRSQDKRIRCQLDDLGQYQPVSSMPAIYRDLSLCLNEITSEEDVGDKIRNHLKEWNCIESVVIKSETSYNDLPSTAHHRMGMTPNQKNILLQLVIRHMERTLTDSEANQIRNGVYKILHEGDRQELAIN